MQVDSSEAEYFLNEFPLAVPGARAIEGVKKYPVENAAHCLVHIRQLHGIEHLLEEQIFEAIKTLPSTDQLVIWKVLWGEKLEDLRYPWITHETLPDYRKFFEAPAFLKALKLHKDARCSKPEVHANIRRIVEYLLENRGLDTFHLEGVHGEMAMLMRKLSVLKEAHLRRRALFLSLPGHERDSAQMRRMWNADASLEYLETMRDRHLGTLLPLFRAGKLHVLPDASDAVGAEAKAVISRHFFGKTFDPSNREFREHLDVRRENALLSQGLGEAVVLARFGGAHRFWPRIQEWNADRSADRYSLIEITPEGYEEDKP